MQRQALVYIRNAGSGATREHLIEDYEPIGKMLLRDITALGMVIEEPDGRLKLTALGEQEIDK